MFIRSSLFAALSAFAISAVKAESHTFQFTNRCGAGTGTPALLLDGNAVSISGDSYTVNGPVDDFTAFFDVKSGQCGSNGAGCPYVHGALVNDGLSHASLYLLAGSGKFTVATGWNFVGGSFTCDGEGQLCASASDCPAVNFPFPAPGSLPPYPYPGINCTGTNGDIAIGFCL